MSERAVDLIETMSIRQKLGQLVVLRAYKYESETRRKLAGGEIGAVGLVLLSGLHGRQLEPLLEAVNTYIAQSPVPILFYIDGENGLAQYFDFGTYFPSMMALGATRSADLAYRMGAAIGRETRAIGFAMISNPTVDVNTNPDNPIINTRAISDRAELVTELAAAYVRGMREERVVPLAKHFPGHGDTAVDSHISMPAVPHSPERLRAVELAPYRELIAKGLDGVMTAHLYVPSLLDPAEGEIPATLSRNAIYRLLRDELGFAGLIVSDSLTMKGIKTAYGIESAAVKALQAGHDLILQDYESDPEATFGALERAIESGELDMAGIDESVRRVLAYKERLGLLERRPVDASRARSILGCEEHQSLAREIAERSVTVLENRHVPLTVERNKSILLVATVSDQEGKEIEDMSSIVKGKAGTIRDAFKRHAEQVDLCPVNERLTEADRQRVESMLAQGDYDAVVFATFIRVVAYKAGSGTISDAQASFIDAVKRLSRRFVLMIFGSPYILRKVERVDTCLCMYGDSDHSIDAALKVLFGAMPARGRLPVDVSDNYPFGSGR